MSNEDVLAGLTAKPRKKQPMRKPWVPIGTEESRPEEAKERAADYAQFCNQKI